MKMNIKTLAICALGASTLALTACSDNNPLMKGDKTHAVKYLYDAATYAGESLTEKQPFGKKVEASDWYIYCMDKSSKAKDCDKVYKRMTEFLTSYPRYVEVYPEFTKTTVSDFKDEAMWKQLGTAFKSRKSFKDLDE